MYKMHTDCPCFSSPLAIDSDYAAGVASVVTAAESTTAVVL